MVDAVPMTTVAATFDNNNGCSDEAPTLVSSNLPLDGGISSGSSSSYDTDESQSEKRQDVDCSEHDNNHAQVALKAPMQPSSPQSPVVVKVRRTRLFSSSEHNQPSIEDERQEQDEYRYFSPPKKMSSQSLAASMFLVSPLRPLARRRLGGGDVMSRSDHDQDDYKGLVDRSSKSLLFHSTGTNPQTQRQLFRYPTRSNSKRQNNKDQQPMPKSKWLIPAEHPYRILWDILTFVLSLLNFYATHTAIRDRQFGNSWFMAFSHAWFILDICLNFLTEYKSDQITLSDFRRVWARYLTTWFVIDVLSLFPGEALYLRPIIDQQNKRNFFQKSFFRSKAVVRVTRFLQRKHFQMFGQAVKHTRHAGFGAPRLLKILIKYIPKYLLFFRNMKGVLVVRMLRQIHWIRKCWRNLWYKEVLVDENGKPVSALRQQEYRRRHQQTRRLLGQTDADDDEDEDEDETEMEDEDDDDDGAPF